MGRGSQVGEDILLAEVTRGPRGLRTAWRPAVEDIAQEVERVRPKRLAKCRTKEPEVPDRNCAEVARVQAPVLDAGR